MIINNDTAKAARASYRTLAIASLFKSPLVPWFRELFMVLQSSSPEETFSFLRGIPRMREWLGDRRLKSISEVSFKVSVKKWEATVSILREDIMFDRFGQISTALAQFGQSYPLHLMDYFTDLFLNGFTDNGYDGQFFFDADHPNFGGGVWVNLDTTTPVDAGVWETAITNAAKIREQDGGRYYTVRWTHLFYGPNSYAAVNAVFGKNTLATGETNVYYNAIPEANRVMVQEFGNTGKYMFADLSKPVKPFIMQVVRNLEFIALDRPTDWAAFAREEFAYGLSSMDNAAYGLPELAYGGTNNE